MIGAKKPGGKLGPENNPGQARWCDTCIPAGRLECTKSRSKGRGQCHAPAVRGTNACTTHVGFTKEVAVARGAARITAWSALGTGADSVDYRMAVLGVLQMSWLRLAAYSDLLRRQYEAHQPEPGSDNGSSPEGNDPDGLIGFRYGAAGKDGNIYAVSEEIRALVRLESEERDRVVKFAKTAHDMGINDRLTSLAERWGDVVATRLSMVIEGLNLSPEQNAKVPSLIQAHLGSIDINSIGGPEPS
jgi:hypothetical protein